jgi:hypothetical protein
MLYINNEIIKEQQEILSEQQHVISDLKKNKKKS